MGTTDFRVDDHKEDISAVSILDTMVRCDISHTAATTGSEIHRIRHADQSEEIISTTVMDYLVGGIL